MNDMELTIENIKKIWLSEEAVCIETKDGRNGKEYFSDYPRLKSATPKQRAKYTISSFGIHWEDVDEDLSFDGFFKTKQKPTDIANIFSKLPELNISAFARRLGISQPLMAAYINGSKIPGKQRKEKIEKELHLFGKQLSEISV